MKNILLILRVALTAAFLYYGLRKLLSGAPDVAIYDALGFGQWPRYVTGTVETVCALGLWVPVWRVLAALGLVGTMIVGTSALVLFTDMPFWHLPLLGIGAAVLAYADRASLHRLLDSARRGD